MGTTTGNIIVNSANGNYSITFQMIIAVFDVQRVGAHLTIIVVFGDQRGKLFETTLQDKNKD